MTRGGEAGFTLVELLVAIVITGIIGGAVSASIIIGLRTTDATANRLADSRDAQLAAAYFGTDVQAADVVDLDPGAPVCVPTTPALDGILALEDQPADGSTPSVVVYAIETGSRDLRRVACKGNELVADVVVAANLLSDDLPNVSCRTASCQVPTSVELTVSVGACAATELNCRESIDRSPYTYQLLGTTRASS